MRQGIPVNRDLKRGSTPNAGRLWLATTLLHLFSLLAILLFQFMIPVSVLADPAYEGLLLYGLDPVLKSTEDPRLLGVERMLMRERLARLGIDPVRDRGLRPGMYSVFLKSWRSKSRVDLVRQEQVIEYNGVLGLMTVIEYPTYFFLFPTRQVLAGGFVYYPPRPIDDPVVNLFIDELDGGQVRSQAVKRRLTWDKSLNLLGSGAAGSGDKSINLTIPIKLPRTLEKIIGRGEKTRIKISGREHISIGGESTVVDPFIPNERISKPSYFPSLDMKQELNVNLSGTIGEKIILEVDHNSEAFGADGTQIKLMYRGLEDEVINTIEAGDVGLTLPNSNLLGYNSSESGLFGVKVTGQVGRADFTVVASKQKAEASSKTFNSSGGSMEDIEIPSYRYLNNRFFFLDLPGLDSPGRGGGSGYENYSIDPTSIRVYKQMGAGTYGVNDIRNVAVYLDDTGLFDPLDFDDPYFYSKRWRLVPVETMLDQLGNLVAIDLRQQMERESMLAVVYQLTDGAGGLVKVGDIPGLDEANRHEIEGESYYRMKLLKASDADKESYTFRYVLRNIYSLGGARIDPASFELKIERVDAGAAHPDQDENGIPYIQIFGLDKNDGAKGPPDGLADKTDTYIFDLQKGLLKFPLNFPEPFNASRTQYEGYANDERFVWDNSFLKKHPAPGLYDPEVNQTHYDEYGYFKLIASHASVASSFSLGASNIEEGSEVVTLDGRTLVRDTDYEIDYTFGQITLKGDNAILTPSSQIAVNFSYAPFMGGGKSSLMGFNLGYDIGQGSKLSTTWLYQSEAIVGEKAKLGEEPSRTLVGNVNFMHTFKPYVLTHVANFISRRDSEKESTVQLSGELAASLPNSNTMDRAYLEDFEGVDASDIISLTRGSWFWASAPEAYADTLDLSTKFEPVDRVPTVRWFLPRERVLRRYLNPDLEGQERDETQSSMDIYLQADSDGEWGQQNWGGIMRGISRMGLDLSRSQFLEFWVNDSVVDSTQRSGRLHIDFGYISEDGFWPILPDGELETGTYQREDGMIKIEDREGGAFIQEEDGVFIHEEDIGLGGDEWDSQRYSAAFDYDGEVDYSGPNSPFPGINGTARNQQEDTEDLNGNLVLDTENTYFSTVIDLRHTEAFVDVLRDYPSSQVADLIDEGHAWRKYRIPLTSDEVKIVSGDGLSEPNIEAVTHVRIWFEDSAGKRNTVNLQLSELRFLGSRWQREGIRLASDESLLLPGDIELLPHEEFFLGEANNKENPDYRLDPPPFEIPVLNGIEEKEQSILLDFQELKVGHMVRAGKQVSPRGDDYTRYRDMSWYWYNPLEANKDLGLFFRVGSDSLNYYEVSYKFADDNAHTGWKSVKIDLAKLADVKNRFPDPATGYIHSTIPDIFTGQDYNVRVVGVPDLRVVKRYFFGVVNNGPSELAASGYIYFNDVKLEGVKRDMGMARQAAIRLGMADVLTVDLRWNDRDAEFHGLDALQGSGINHDSWNFSTNFKVEDFIPILGFKLPVQINKGVDTRKPKYQINSDVEIFEDSVRDSLTTRDIQESFSTRLHHTPSKAALLRYMVDPWQLTISGSRSQKTSPLERSKQNNLQGSLKYNLRIPGKRKLGDFPLLGSIPVVRGVALFPEKVEVAGSFTSTNNSSVAIDIDGTEIPRAPNKRRPGALKGSMDYKPNPMLAVSFSGDSDRDLMHDNLLYGLNIGRENSRKYSTRSTITMPKPKDISQARIMYPVRQAVRGLNSLRPSLQFTGSFSDVSLPPDLLLEGEDPETHSMSNDGSWDLRLTFPFGDMVKSILPEKKYSDKERSKLLEEQRRHEARDTHRRGPGAQTDLGASSPGSGGKGGEEEELTPEEQLRREEERLLQEAEDRKFEEQDRRGTPLEEGVEEDEGGGPRISLPNPLTLFLNTLRSTKPIKLTLTSRKSSSYGRTPGQATFWYQAGLDPSLDIPESDVNVFVFQDRKNLSMSTSTKVVRSLSLDLKYATDRATNEKLGTFSRDYKQEWPDAQVSLNGIEKWRIFGGKSDDPDGGWFKGSNMSLGYKQTKTVMGMTSVSNDPKTTTSINPRWTVNFHNGMTATLTSSIVRDNAMGNGTLTESNRLRYGLQLKHQFRAQRLLAKIGLYRPGANPTITMDVDINYSLNESVRTSPESEPSAPTGTRLYGVTPRFTYQVSRNLSSGMNLGFNKTSNLATGVSSTKISLGMEVTFVF
ncbi:MAG: cell surface protein SprA [Gemmatimonadales bacterium]|nr:cell surface protein SprA [Gemmatimonadales bacterium]